MLFKSTKKKLTKIAYATFVINLLPSVSTIQIPYPRFITTTTEFPSLIKPVTRIHNNHIHYVPVQNVYKIRPVSFKRMLSAPTSVDMQKADTSSDKMPNSISTDNSKSVSLVSRILQV